MEEQSGTFLKCLMCENNDCQFRRCSDTLRGSIFCKSISDTSQRQITEIFTTSQESVSASTFLSNHSTSEKLFASTSTTGSYDRDQSSLTNYTERMSSNVALLYKRGKIVALF